MIRPSRSLPHPSTAAWSEELGSAPRSNAYGPPFWFAYAANIFMMTGVSLLFRYADFITQLGGTEFHLGWIVGVGMVGSLAMRLVVGSCIDHYGSRAVWLGSILLFSAACFAHLTITHCHGPAIYALRIVWCCAVAGFFGAMMTFISGRASVARMAEMIGVLGTAGFLGMIAGTQLGDQLLSKPIARWQIERMFATAGLLGLGSAAFVYLSTRGCAHAVPQKRPAPLRVLRRYRPGKVFVVGIAMGIGLGLPGTFLATYVAELGLPGIGLFFGVYAPTAIVTRLLTRRLPERLGTTPMILAGIAALSISQLLFLPVDAEWWLIVPGIGYGIAHAVLFPSIVAAGSRSFPPQHRGLGTTVMLSTWDLGTLVGAPTAGAILEFSSRVGLPSYPTLFISVAILLGGVGVYFGLSERRAKSRDIVIQSPQPDELAEEPGEPAVATSSCEVGE